MDWPAFPASCWFSAQKKVARRVTDRGFTQRRQGPPSPPRKHGRSDEGTSGSQPPERGGKLGPEAYHVLSPLRG
jgi:hypothetical protein